MHERLRKGRTLRAVLTGADAILHCLVRVATMAVVIRELCDVVIEALTVCRFQRGTDTLVQQAAAFSQDRLVGDVMGEGVFEGVFDIARRGLLIDELTYLKRGEHLL